MSYHSLRFEGVEKYDSIKDETIVDITKPKKQKNAKRWTVKVKLSTKYKNKLPNRFFPFTADSESRANAIYKLLKQKQNMSKLRDLQKQLEEEKQWNHKNKQLVESKGLKVLKVYENAKEHLKQTDTNRQQQFWAKHYKG